MSTSPTLPDGDPPAPDTMPSELPKEALSVSSTATTLPRYSNQPESRMDGDVDKDISSFEKHGFDAPVSASTSSRTRDRLREAELELKKLQEAMREERAVAERLKKEGAGTDPSSAEFKRRISQLERDVRGSDIKTSRPSNTGLFKAMCSVDLLFLIDTTASMMGHINAAKTQVRNIVDAILEAFFNEAEVRIAVVGYKDHQDSPNIQFLDFVRSADRVRSFLAQLKATGGGDVPEDVLGGLRQALNASWKHPTRCIIHIADAPPHGTMFHTSTGVDDSYPVAGSEPHHLTIDPLLQQMIKGLKINYALLRINNNTDKMAFTIFEAYRAAAAQCKLLEINKFYSEAFGPSSESRTLFQSSNAHVNGTLQFEEAELGTAYSDLQHLVIQNITNSVSRTVSRLSASPARAGKHWMDKKLTSLGAVEEDEDNAGRLSLETVLPQWSSPEWFNKTLMAEGFSPDVVFHGANTLDEMMASDDNIKMRTTDLTIRKRGQPFAQGAMRVASYARTAASTNRFVVKSYKKGGKRLAHLAEDMRCQALCKAFALEFNALSGESQPIDFIVTTCFRDKRGRTSTNECMSLEPFLEGKYVKYNTNGGWVLNNTSGDRFNEAAQAFSHFTFERSRGRLLVSDLQGVGGLLTDPAVHALDRKRFRLSDTNLGTEGFKFFFASHKCNRICMKLELKSNASMIKTGNYKFRKDWPSCQATVTCCSNKLCGKIIHLDRAKESERYPGYQWCDTCFPQLEEFMVKWICVVPGAFHEFEDSKFHFETQGQSMPRKCAKHRIGGEIGVNKTSKISQSDLSKLFKNEEMSHKPDTIEEDEEDVLLGTKDGCAAKVHIKGDEVDDEAKTSRPGKRKCDPQNKTTSKSFGSTLKSAFKGLTCFS